MYEATVVGFRHSTGSFQGNNYDNYMVHVTMAPTRDDHQGQMVMEVKVPARMGYVPRVGDEIILHYGPNGLSRVEVM